MKAFRYLIPMLLILSGSSLHAQLSGSYTLGGDSPDFETFTEAIDALVNQGINGQVIFNVRDGEYNEQITIPSISGASGYDNIIFQPESEDNPYVLLMFEGSSSNNYTVELNGADGITFRLMAIEASSGDYSRAIVLRNGAHHNTFYGNMIYAPDATDSSTVKVLIYSEPSLDEYNLFLNNEIAGGSYGILLNSTAGNEGGNRIDNNIFNGQFSAGLKLISQDAVKVRHNSFSGGDADTAYSSLFCEKCDDSTSITGNSLNSPGLYGIRMENCTSVSGREGIISNNFIFIRGPDQCSGLNLASCTYQNIYFNSINVAPLFISDGQGGGEFTYAADSRAINLQGGSNLKILNNILSNHSNGYSIYTNSTSNIAASDHNDLYSSGNKTGFWSGVQPHLESWVVASGLDANSLSIDPGFVAAGGDMEEWELPDLHITEVALNRKGVPVAGITSDIDGEFRDASHPDIGADEISPPAVDAGLLSISEPQMPFPKGENMVKVVLKNYGDSPLTDVEINWEVNSAVPSVYNWSGNLLSGDTALVEVGIFDFSSHINYSVRAWTSNPNVLSDTIPDNDEVASDLFPALSGEYTIGGSSPDFSNFQDAVAALSQGGVIDSVLFNVRDGIYSEQFEIPEIIGANDINSIIFQSETGDSVAVSLEFSASSVSSNYVIRLSGADGVTFRKMTLKANGSTYSRVIEAEDGTNNLILKNNLIQGVGGTTSTNKSLIYSQSFGGSDNNFIFRNNRFADGSYGINLSGDMGAEIVDNIFENQHQCAISFIDWTSASVRQNFITTNALNSNYRGIQITNGTDSLLIYNNQIFVENGGYGVYLANCAGTPANRGLTANNFIQVGRGTGNDHGIHLDQCAYQNVFYNSVHITSTSATNGKAYYNNLGADLVLKNNIFANTGGGYAIHGTGAIAESDYNDLYTSGSVLGNWAGTNQNNLAAWKGASGMDVHSLNWDPRFAATSDLHVRQPRLDAAGTPLADVSNDIDGEPRHPTTPDIGADEFNLPVSEDVGIVRFLSPAIPFAGGMQDVIVQVKSFDTTFNNVIYNFKINWTVNGIPQTPFDWSGILYYGDSADITIALDFDFAIFPEPDISVWTSLPNGISDINTLNDTASIKLFDAMSGIYAIGQDTLSDFGSFQEAIDALILRGLVDSVLFNVKAGTYAFQGEGLTIPEIAGAAGSNSVIFQPMTGDNSSVTIKTTLNLPFLIKLDGADGFTFRNLTFDNIRGSVFHIANGANENFFVGNVMKGYVNSSYYSPSYPKEKGVIYSSGINYNNSFLNNRLEKGSYGIIHDGDITAPYKTQNLTIAGNYFEGAKRDAIFLTDVDGIVVSGNHLQPIGSSERAIHISSCTGIMQIVKNHIYMVIGAYAGIELNMTGDGINTVLIANNLVDMNVSSASRTGIALIGCSKVDVVCNNVRIKAGNNSHALRAYSGSQYKIVNNILANFSNASNGYAIWTNSASNISESDHNNFYTTGSNLAYYQSGAISDLPAWQAASGHDDNSLSVDPMFVSSNDLHIRQPLLDEAGLPHPEVADDIDGDTRNAVSPDIGADEVLFDDVGILEIINPAGGCVKGEAGGVSVLLKNFGLSPQSGFNVGFFLNDAPATIENTGALTLASGDTAMFTFSGLAEFPDTIHSVTVFAALSGDGNFSNDSLERPVLRYSDTLSINLTPDSAATACIGSSLTISAGGADSYLWNTGSTNNWLTVHPESDTQFVVTYFKSGKCSDDTVRITANMPPAVEFTFGEGYDSSWVHPDNGTSLSLFTFSADFFDDEGDLPKPGFPKVQLDFEGDSLFGNLSDLNFTMFEADPLDQDATDGKRYLYYADNIGESNNWQTRIVAEDLAGCASVSSLTMEPVVSGGLPDLTIFANDITFSEKNPDIGEQITISAKIRNNSDFTAYNFQVSLYQEDSLVSTLTLDSLRFNSNRTVSWAHSFTYENFFPMKVVIDEPNVVNEINELNNFAIRPVIVGDYNVPGELSVTAFLSPITVYTGQRVYCHGNSEYSGVFGSDFDVSGAAVSFRVLVGETPTGAAFTGFTNANGDFISENGSDGIPFTISAPGTYTIVGEVTDYTLVGEFGPLTLNVITRPHGPNLVGSINIAACSKTLNHDRAAANKPLNGSATLRNTGEEDAGPFRVVYYTCETTINDTVIPSLAAGAILYLPTFTVEYSSTGDCFYDIQVDADDEVAEKSESDNSDYSEVTVIPNLPDLSPESRSLVANPDEPTILRHTISNTGGASSGIFYVSHYDLSSGFEELIGTDTMQDISGCSLAYGSISHTFTTAGVHPILIKADNPFNIVLESNEANNTTLYHVYVLPDFEVRYWDFSVDPATPRNPGDTLHLRARIQNTGSDFIAGDSLRVTFRVDAAGANSINSTIYTGGIERGESALVSYPILTPPFGNNLLTVTADSADDITERLESNNADYYPLCWDFEFKQWGSTLLKPIYAGTPVNLTLSIYNSGLYTADTLWTYFYINGELVGADVKLNVTPAFPTFTGFRSHQVGGSIFYTFPEAGIYDLDVYFDHPNDWIECDETNNHVSRQIVVGNPRSDLRILSHQISSSELNPDENEPVDIYLSYENTGAAASDSFTVRCHVDDVQQGLDINVAGISQGRDTTVAVTQPWSTPQPGAHVIRGFVDYYNSVEESYELNNEASRVIIVGDAPNLLVQDILISDSVYSEFSDYGYNIRLNAIIENEGNTACAADVKFFYIANLNDTIEIGSTSIFVDPVDTAITFMNWDIAIGNPIIHVKIVNSNPLEYWYGDNEFSRFLGPTFRITEVLHQDVSCYGYSDGKVAVSGSGGLPPYSYKWSNNDPDSVIANMPPGVYSITVTDIGDFTTTANLTIIEPFLIHPKPVVQASGDSVICDGESVTLSADLTENISWTNGQNGSAIQVHATGDYKAYYYDSAGCAIFSEPYHVEVIKAPVITTYPFNTSCIDDPVTVGFADTIPGINDWTFAWSTGDTSRTIIVAPPDTTTYMVTGNHQIGCAFTGSATVFIAYPVPVGSVSSMLPADGADDIDKFVQLSWGPGLNATHYDLYVWPDTLPRPAIPLKSNMTDLAFLYLGENGWVNNWYGKSFNWQVVSKNFCNSSESAVQTFSTRHLPDLIIENVQLPVSAFTGQTISVQFTVKNIGRGKSIARNTSGWTEVLFLSQDQLVNVVTDALVGQIPNPSSLNPGEQYVQTAYFQIPDGFQGHFNLLVVTGARMGTGSSVFPMSEFIGSVIKESNYFNNMGITAIPMFVNLSPPPDLQVTSIIKPTTAFSGQPINVEWTVENRGTGVTVMSGWEDRVYLSKDSVFRVGSATSYETFSHQGILFPGDSYTNTRHIILPEGGYGKYYIFITTDFEDMVFEHTWNGNNTARSDSINVVLTPPPDIIAENIHLSIDSVNLNELAQINYNLRNIGLSVPDASSFQNHLYISTAPFFHPDSAIGFGSHSSSALIEPGFSLEKTRSIRIKDLPSGKYYIYVLVDDNDRIYEHGGEDNNVARSDSTFTLLNPDLQVASVAAPAADSAGKVILVEWVVRNNGPGSILASSELRDRVYLSRHPNPDSVILLGMTAEREIKNTFSGDTLHQQLLVRLPRQISGQCYIFVETDFAEAVFEGNSEDNNISSASIFLYPPSTPDLTVAQFALPDPPIRAGDNVQIAVTVENTGNAGINEAIWNDLLYVSTQPDFSDSTAKLLKSVTNTFNLLPGSNYQLLATVQMPPPLLLGAPADSGDCYLFVKLDNGDAIFEFDGEHDNIQRAGPLFVSSPGRVDLAVASLVLNNTLSSGTLSTVNWTVTNAGVSTRLWGHAQWFDALYFSVDAVWDSSDILIRQWQRDAALGNGESYSASERFSVPNGISGDFYFLMVTDHTYLAASDTSRQNNFRAVNDSEGAPVQTHVELSPSPDLVITDFQVPVSAINQDPITVSWTVTNQGDTTALPNSWTESFYLSTDFSIGGNDQELGSYVYPDSLPAGASYSHTAILDLPNFGNNNMFPANRVVLMRTDDNNQIYENNGENNNTAFGMLQIDPQEICDLTVTDVSFNDSVTYYSGQLLLVHWVVKNIEHIKSALGGLDDAVYLSEDTAWDVSDIFLGMRKRDEVNIPPQFSLQQSIEAALNNVPVGDYYVIVRTDATNRKIEASENNNTGVSHSRLRVDVPELPLNVLTPDTLKNNSNLYYRIEINDTLSGKDILVTLKGDSASAFNEIYARHGQLPSRTVYQHKHDTPYQGNQEMVIPDLREGTQYTLAYGNTPADTMQNISLYAELLEFQIRSVDANVVGNSGNATVRIKGVKFTNDMQAELRSSDLEAPIVANRVRYVKSTEIFATFALLGADTGVYDLIVKKPDNQEAVLESGLFVVAGSDSSFTISVRAPSFTLKNTPVSVSVHITNTGNIDLPNPHRRIVALSGEPLAFPLEEFHSERTVLDLNFRELEGPTDVFRPGVTAHLTIVVKAPNHEGFIRLRLFE